jgi:hypothetical protein
MIDFSVWVVLSLYFNLSSSMEVGIFLENGVISLKDVKVVVHDIPFQLSSNL